MNEIALYEASDYFSKFVADLSNSYTAVVTEMNNIINNNLSSGKNTLQEKLAAYYDDYHMLLYVVAQFLKAQYERVSSEIVQLNDSINMTITRVEEEIWERKKHMKFSEDGLELFTTINGEIGKFKVVLAENRLSFYEEGNEVAYMSNEKLYISKAEITTSLQIGDVVGRKSSNNGFVFH
jgi:gas vesicle protein